MRLVPRSALMVAATATLVALPATALALPGSDGGSGDDSGYSVQVSVNLSGDGAPGGGGNFSLHIPPTCWWTPIEIMPGVDISDPEEVREYFEEEIRPWLTGHAGAGNLAWPDYEVWEDAILRAADGEEITFYQLEGVDAEAKIPCSPGTTTYEGVEMPITYYPFATGEEPDPVIDPEDLAEAARDELVIEAPEVDRNPKGAGSLGGATLVNMPTWFWVTNPEESVGGSDGERTIRAEVVGGDVWAEVTAQTGGLSVASPAGSQFCEPGLAITEWSQGANDAEGCTVEFSRASVAYPGGYPVTTSTEWNASWEGMTQDGESVGGDLDPLSQSTEVTVPVAESQATVTTSR